MKFERKIAALDIGSNSVMLLLISYDRNMQIKILDEFGAITKLENDLDQSKIITANVMDKTLNLCKEITEIAYDEGAETIIVTVSCNIQHVLNKTEFLVACHSHFNIFPQLLTGNEKASCIFNGALHDFNHLDGDILILDVGGNSLNISFGSKNIMVGHFSFNLASIPLLDQFKIKASSTGKSKRQLKKYIKTISTDAIMEILTWLDGRTPTVICCGGTTTTMASILSKQNYYDRHLINKAIITTKEADTLAGKLVKMSLKNRRNLLGLEHDRAEYLHIGIYTICYILKHLEINEFNVTTSGLRTGILKSYIDKNFG